ncbi:MAG: acetylgalactosaminidase [Flavobacteriales bacterium]|nr:acetylgalactosaminidase [Flavobacteriales bacterium]|tara:strand:- start:7940 stop:9331 length:1392 start_codon:yes stop_codon:yes gene_type:complete
MKRKEFLQSIIGASAFLGLPFKTLGAENNSIQDLINNTKRDTDGSMFGFTTDKINKIRVGIIGLGNRGNTLLEMFQYLVEKNHAEIIALSDITEKKVRLASEKLSIWQKKKATIYHKNNNEWKKLCKRDDIDLIIIATPWNLHATMALYSMENGKHVGCEVPIATNIEDCWKIIETSERTKKHCMMMENCNYNEEELWVLNMIQEGVFGDITHTEGAYLHDLRALMLDDTYYENQWRLLEHTKRNGNLYTTHGLGPISFYLNIGRGDTFSHLSSMSSRELNLSNAAKQINHPIQSYKCGDMNNTMIKTKKGKTILLQFDVHTGRPYSRINKLVGTKAVHDGYPSRLYIEGEEPTYWGHNWLKKEEYNKYRSKYQHPIMKKLKVISSEFKQGHGGMDFIMIYRIIRCLNLGLPLDINVYDSVMWSSITPLSELSVAANSQSIIIPDFTAGIWEKENPLEIMKEV